MSTVNYEEKYATEDPPEPTEFCLQCDSPWVCHNGYGLCYRCYHRIEYPEDHEDSDGVDEFDEEEANRVVKELAAVLNRMNHERNKIENADQVVIKNQS